MRRATVRFLRDVTVRNVDPGTTWTYRAGTTADMVQHEDDPTSWWTDFDIDAAYIVEATDVEIVAEL